MLDIGHSIPNTCVVTEGTPEQLKSGLRGDAVVIEFHEASVIARVLESLGRIGALREVAVEGRTVRARADDGGAALPLVLNALDAEDIAVASATVSRPSLDDVYLAHTGHSFASAHERSTRDRDAERDADSDHSDAALEEVAS